MNRLNKKAVSAVVATVLIIMITVAAVGIIWAAIIPMVRDSLTKGTVCNDALSDISLVVDGGYTCINNTALCLNATVDGTQNVPCGAVSLQIKKGPNAKVDLISVDALIFVGGDSFAYRIEKNNTNTMSEDMNGTSGTLPTSNVERTVSIWGVALKNATKVKIAPVVTVGKTEQVCEATQEVILAACKA